MAIRTNIFPRTIADAAVTTFLFLIIPTVYWFELFIVLPAFYVQWSFWYTFHFICGTFILLNITANYAAIIFCDTSIKGRMLPSNLAPHWRFCSVCETVAPPRSWHCNVCNTCILKRDHHCMFTSCCIGHFNQRYFMVFVFYMFIATVYATYYNVFFIAGFVELRSWMSLFKIVFPLAMVFVEWSIAQIFLFLTLIIVIGSIFTGVLLYFHCDLITKGKVTYERNRKLIEYDLGKMKNWEDVLGEKWYLVWLSPFIESKQLRDGIYWDPKVSNKAK